MSDFSPIAWTEGMFLRPQHFQQQDRYYQSQLATIQKRMRSFYWGVNSLSVSQADLALGKFLVSAIEGIFPDQTQLSLPTDAELPQAKELNSEAAGQLIYLCIAENKTNGLNVSDSSDQDITRYKLQDQNIVDITVGHDAIEVLQIVKISSQIKLEKEDRSGFISLPIAKVAEVTPEGAITLDKQYIAPLLCVEACPLIKNKIKHVSGMIKQRSEAIAVRLKGASGVSNGIADFLMLQLLNKYQPIFVHLNNDLLIHPEELYRLLISFSAELATFNNSTRLAPTFIQYQHDNLSAVFSQIFSTINQSLSLVFEQTALELKLEKSQFGIYFTAIKDNTLINKAQFVLAVKASVTHDELRNYLPQQTKVGSVESIRDLVNNQLPGVGLVSLPVAPREIPHHTGYHYFELDKTSPHWSKLVNSGGIAVHFSGNYPELSVELWAINSN